MCADFNALRLAMQKKFTDLTDRTAFTNAAQNIKVNRGVLRSTHRAALQAVASAKNTANIAAVNRPNQILAQKALVANAQSAVFSGQLAVKNTFVYAPSDGTVAGTAGTAGEFTAGGNNLTPTTPTIGGSGARIPTVGPLAAADQKNFTGGNQLSATNPTGGAFMQISDLNAFQVVAIYPEGDAVQITPGSLSKVTFDALPGKEYDGTVTSIAAIGIAGPNGAAQYYATVLLNNAPPEVRSGMAANVSVVVAPRQQLTA
ncbi:MAG: HlyD family efflux transporter periplasmic adaptor subunit [Actinomycetota bacterium]|nr:HlyD family efflux transporter periplasmic adaptor subunit [Actinomycetota bacterium]